MSRWEKLVNRKWDEAVQEYDFKEYLKHANIDTSNISLEKKEELLNASKFLTHKPVAFVKEMLDMNKEWELQNIEPPHDDYQEWALEPEKVDESLPIDLRQKPDSIVRNAVMYLSQLGDPSNEPKNDLYNAYEIIRQNIKRALSFSNDESEFYDLLMNIQQYLSNVGMIKEDGTSLYMGTNGVIDEDISQFNIEEFKHLLTFEKRVMYAKEHLQFLGQGSSRMVFKFHDNKILKLAKNNKGIAQNSTEAEIFDDSQFEDIVATIYEYDDNFNWLISEYAPRMTDAQFQQIEGYKFRTLGIVLSDMKYGRNIKNDLTPEEYSAFTNSQSRLANGLIELMDTYNMPVGDLIAKTSYGISNKDGHPSVVLIDYGLSEEVYNDHYSRVREAVLREMKQYFTERILSSMPDSSTVDVEERCKLGGNGDGTSDPCNQGEIKNLKIKSLKEFVDEPVIQEREEKIEYGALMAYFKIKNWKDVLGLIREEDIYDKPTFGLEQTPHVTILYGFHDEVDPHEVLNAITSVNSKPIDVELVNISIFESEEFDVVKFDVKSEILHKLNKIASEFPHTTDYPDYHPHMTISYVKKGCGEKYVKTLDKPLKLKSKELIFSTKDNEKTPLTVKENQNLNLSEETAIK